MKSGLRTISVLVWLNLFLVAYSGVPYSSKCPKIRPLTELTVEALTGQFHDIKQTSVTPYHDAYWCNYKNDSDKIITNFTATYSATLETYETDILTRLAYNEEEPVGYYIDVFSGYYEHQVLWLLGSDPDPVEGYYCDYSCTENKDGTLTFTFQYEPRGCKMTEKHEKNLNEILERNNLKGRDDFKLRDGFTDKCVEDIQCPPEFHYQ